jgi:short-subunit dehydrogenase
MPTQDLKRKYDAQWALVTGSSSGIGKSLASRLASQGLNIVMVALNDRLLDDAVSELKTTFKSGQFIKVGVDLGVPGYLDIIAEATKDLDVQIVFNNAGFMLTGFFDKQ